MGFLSGITDALFGSSEPETKIHERRTLTPEQQEIMKVLSGTLTQDPESAAQPSQTRQIAPLSGLENLSLEALEQQIMQAATGDSGTGTARQTLDRLAQEGPQDFEEYFQRTVQEPALDEFSDLMDQIARGQANTFFSSERRQADTDAREDLLDALTRERARTAFEARESALGRQLEASRILPSLDANMTNLLLGGLEAGAVPRSVDQAGFDAQQEEFLRQREAVEKRIQQMIQALGITGKENIAVQEGGSSGLLGGFLSGAGAGIGSAAATSKFLPMLAASEKHIKRDIKVLGKRPDGLDIISFRYRWEEPGTTHVGLLADQVQELYPDAIHDITTPDGERVKGVDYARVP